MTYQNTATLHHGHNWWVVERGSNGFDNKAHGPFELMQDAESEARARGLKLVRDYGEELAA